MFMHAPHSTFKVLNHIVIVPILFHIIWCDDPLSAVAKTNWFSIANGSVSPHIGTLSLLIFYCFHLILVLHFFYELGICLSHIYDIEASCLT